MRAQERVRLAEEGMIISLEKEEILTETLRLHRKRISKQYKKIEGLELQVESLTSEVNKILR